MRYVNRTGVGRIGREGQAGRLGDNRYEVSQLPWQGHEHRKCVLVTSHPCWPRTEEFLWPKAQHGCWDSPTLSTTWMIVPLGPASPGPLLSGQVLTICLLGF